MGQWWLGWVGAIAISVAGASNAAAQAATESGANAATRNTGQESFAFGAELGFYNPNGLTLRAGARAISVEVAAGFVPILLSYGSSQSPDYKLLFPFEVTPQLVIHALTFRNEIRGALRLGYRYNADLGHGATLGLQISKRMTRLIALEGIWGISYYPRAADRLRGDQVPAGTSFNFPPELGAGVSVGVLFYP